jgi:hypothetical protein
MYADSLKLLNSQYFYCHTTAKAIEILNLRITEKELDELIDSATEKN